MHALNSTGPVRGGKIRTAPHGARVGPWLDVCCAVNVPLPLTDTVKLPVNGPCKSRYLAINVICSTVLSLIIHLYYCSAVFPGLYPNTTYMPNTDYTDYTDNRVFFINWTDSVNAICATTISSNIQLWYCQTLITLITLTIESFLSSEQITLTLSVQRRYILTYSLGNTAIQYHNCMLEDMIVAQIALTLSVQMV